MSEVRRTGPILSVEALEIAFPGRRRHQRIQAVAQVGFTVREGETWAVVGPVGAGKTTLAEVLLGQHRLDAGHLAWPLLERLLHHPRCRFGRMPPKWSEGLTSVLRSKF